MSVSHAKMVLAAALLYRERFGFSVIPMGFGKKPLIKWIEFQGRRAELAEILEWPLENLAVVTGAISGIVIADFETRQDAIWFNNHVCRSPAIVQTRRGYHLYYRHPGERVMNGTKLRFGESEYDIRGDGGYALLPPSSHSEGNYRWYRKLTDPKSLPVFRQEWRPVKESRSLAPVGSGGEKIRDVYKYIAKIEAVSGNGGHNTTYEVACLLRESGMSQSEALGAIRAWNETNATPPWDDRDLQHKIRSAYR